MNKPLMVCLYAGLHGWEEGAVAAGFRCVGYDIVDMCELCNMPRPDNCELILRDVRSIHGSELKDAALIVGSSPCQEFSYRAMPWKRAKALGPPILGMELFNAQFRIQREAIEAAGHYIPLVVENVRGAQKWVGRARANYGSFFLWGDVGMVGRRVVAISGAPAFGRGVQAMPREVMKQGVAHRSDGSTNFHQGRYDGQKGVPHRPTGHWTNPAENGSMKGMGLGSASWQSKDERSPNDPRNFYSKSPKRKQASALIAKIPMPLSSYIARAFLPHP